MSQWSPTHVQVTVIRAKNLIPKSKNGGKSNQSINQSTVALRAEMSRSMWKYSGFGA